MVMITSPGAKEVKELVRQFSPKPKARELMRAGQSSRNMENVETIPFEQDERSLRITAKSTKLRLLVEEAVRVGSISIEDSVTELAKDINVSDVSDIEIQTIPDKDYYIVVRKRDRDLQAKEITRVAFTAIHE